jgi:ABC-type amino acid transport substrate-binding protein
MLTLACLAIFAGAMTACGSAANSATAPGPTGTYSIVLNATGAAPGSSTTTHTLNLNVVLT